MKKTITSIAMSLALSSTLFAEVDCTQTHNVQSFAERFYIEVLDRQPDNAGLDSWTNDLTSRSKTGADVAAGFVFSEEYIAKDSNNGAFVTTLYKAFFNRVASEDPEGFSYWVDQLNRSVSREEVSNGFIYSAEFANLSASYGIQAYEGATFTTTALDNFVKRFYSVILGRDADNIGLKSWTDKLSTNKATGSDIAFGFIFSAEYDLGSKTNTEYINTLYTAFFDRPADQAGFDGWMTELTNGSTQEEVLNGFLHSHEFINLTNSFGILAFAGAPEPSTGNNLPPQAQISTNTQTANFSDPVTLDASSSSDAEGSILCHWWVENTVQLSSSESFTKTDFSVGDHNIRLTVVDAVGVSSSESVTLTINEASVPTTITHNGTTYGFVTSPHTGKVWLDRNLGAARVCESFNDTACYGDYYQWGRNFDGHEDSGSATTNTQAKDVNDAGTDFIIGRFDWVSIDGTGAIRRANWSKTDGSSVCPVGFKVPSITELSAELLGTGSAQISNRLDAFNSFLKLPSAGYNLGGGALYQQGSRGQVWSSSVYGLRRAYHLFFRSASAGRRNSESRINGFSVRCLRD